MRASIRKDIQVTLEMTETEATWLMGLMQNQIHPDETQEDMEERKKIFSALKDILIQDTF
jgi:hypothetical protein